MRLKESITKGLVLILVTILLPSLYFGCSKKAAQKERPAVSKSDSRQIPQATEQEIKYSNETGKINTLADKLNASKTPETAREVETQMKKPASFIESHLQTNPDTPEGATALWLIAKTYLDIDSQIGNQQEQITKAYRLIKELYPKSSYATEAQNWLDSHK